MQITIEEPRVGRNEPCPCGSGQKYKKCCWTAHQRGPASSRTEGAPAHYSPPSPPRNFSQILVEYAAPLLEMADSEDALKRAVAMAALCYDLGLIQDERARERAIEDAIERAIPMDQPFAQEEMRMIIDRMLVRHLVMFPALHVRGL